MITPKYRLGTLTPHGTASACVPQTGIPFRLGSLPLLRPDEFNEVEYSFDFGCQSFDLGKPEELKAYVALMDRISNGELIRYGKILESWSDQTQSWHVLIRWNKPYAEIPARLRRPARG